MSIRELLSVPSIRTLAWSSFAMSFLGTAYTVVFILFCYTPIDKGGLGFSVRNLPRIYGMIMIQAFILGDRNWLHPSPIVRRVRAAPSSPDANAIAQI
jgi:hypothetical protein